MRLVKLYQVLDKRAESVIGPIFANTNEVPVARELQEHVNKPDSLIGQHPGDFACVLLGYQDLDTGKIDPLETPELVFECVQLLRQGPRNAESSQPT